MVTTEETNEDKSLSGFLRKERTLVIGAFVAGIVIAIFEPHRSMGYASAILVTSATGLVSTMAWYLLVYRKTGLSQRELSRQEMR